MHGGAGGVPAAGRNWGRDLRRGRDGARLAGAVFNVTAMTQAGHWPARVSSECQAPQMGHCICGLIVHARGDCRPINRAGRGSRLMLCTDSSLMPFPASAPACAEAPSSISRPPPKRQRTGAVHDLADHPAPQMFAKRLGLRWPSTAFPSERPGSGISIWDTDAAPNSSFGGPHALETWGGVTVKSP